MGAYIFVFAGTSTKDLMRNLSKVSSVIALNLARASAEAGPPGANLSTQSSIVSWHHRPGSIAVEQIERQPFRYRACCRAVPVCSGPG